MGSYTVVIIPDSVNGNEVSGDVPRLTIQVHTTASESRVTGIAINTTDPGGLTPQNVLDIDIEAIVTALAVRFPPSGSRATSADAPIHTPAQQSEQMTLDEGPASGAGSPAQGVPATDAEGGRAYRRMPEVSELRMIYQQLGTVTAVAKHYGVPRHTAQGWMGRLRKLDQPRETDARKQ